MSKRGRWILLSGACFGLLQLALCSSIGSEGPVHTIQLPTNWTPALYTDLTGWSGWGSSQIAEISPPDPSTIKAGLRPGDLVHIHCRTWPAVSGRYVSVLTYRIEGTSGPRRMVTSSDPWLFAGLLASALVPVLLSALIAIELNIRRQLKE